MLNINEPNREKAVGQFMNFLPVLAYDEGVMRSIDAGEVLDIALRGTSATMLSGETANGKYPVEAVRTMARIAERTEKDINYAKRFSEHTIDNAKEDVTNAISHATCLIAYRLNAAAIITVTKSCTTAYMISRWLCSASLNTLPP